MSTQQISILFGLLALPLTLWASGPSTVDGISIKNTHFLTEERGEIYRGSQPGKKVSELVDFGITDVLIIKNDTKGEVGKEMQALLDLGLSKNKITHLPISWDGDVSIRENCLMFVTALEKVRDTLQKGGKMFLHCSAGEDRTGVVAGIVRMLQEGWSQDQAFHEEMCAYGYAEKGKPEHVARKVRVNLTPIFLLLAKQIENGSLHWENLGPAACKSTVESTADSELRCN